MFSATAELVLFSDLTSDCDNSAALAFGEPVDVIASGLVEGVNLTAFGLSATLTDSAGVGTVVSGFVIPASVVDLAKVTFPVDVSTVDVGVALIGLLFFRGVCLVLGETAEATFGDSFGDVVAGELVLVGETVVDPIKGFGDKVFAFGVATAGIANELFVDGGVVVTFKFAAFVGVTVNNPCLEDETSEILTALFATLTGVIDVDDLVGVELSFGKGADFAGVTTALDVGAIFDEVAATFKTGVFVGVTPRLGTDIGIAFA